MRRGAAIGIGALGLVGLGAALLFTGKAENRPIAASRPAVSLIAAGSETKSGDGVVQERERLAAAGRSDRPATETMRSLEKGSIASKGPANREIEAAWERELRAKRLALVSKGNGYGNNNGTRIVSFDPARVQVAGVAKIDERHPYVRYAFEGARQGAEVLAQASQATPRLEGRSVVYDRGLVQEKYEVTEEGTEQFFVLAALPSTGDVVISGKLESNLKPVANAKGVSFQHDGVEVAYYKEAYAVDAAGQKTSIPVEYAAGEVKLTVPAEWLARAALPVTVDPFIGTAAQIDPQIKGIMARPHDVVWNSVDQEYVVVWNEAFTTDSNGNPTDYDIKAQRFSAQGAAIGPWFYVDWPNLNSWSPRASYSPETNRILIVWVDDGEQSSLGLQIHGRVLKGGSNSFLGAEFTVNSETDGNGDHYPDVAYDGAKWFVAYQRLASGSPYGDIRGQFVTTDGAPTGTAVNVVTDSWDSRRPAVEYLDGKYLVVWSDHSSTTAKGQIWGRTVSPEGTAGSLTVYASASDDKDRDWPELAANSTNNEYLLIWQVNQTVGDVYDTPGDVFARRVAAAGTALAAAFAVQEDTADQFLPSVTWNKAANQYLVAWGEGSAVQNQSVAQMARIAGGSNEVLANDVEIAGNPSRYPGMGSSAGSEVLVVYLSKPNGTTFEFWAKRFDFNTPPGAPTDLTQHDYSSAPAQGPGFLNDDATVTFKAQVSDPDAGDTVKLEVEIRPVGTAFTGTATGTSSAVAGGLATVTISNVAPGSHHWQARTVDAQGAASAWVSFGNNAESAADFHSSTLPSAPSQLSQHDTATGPAESAGYADDDGTVVFKAVVSDNDAGETLKLQVEVKAVGAAFDAATLYESEFVAIGQTAVVSVNNFANGEYHWRARAVDNWGLKSIWKYFGTSSTTTADFSVAVFWNNVPAVPTGLAQFKSNGSTGLSVGATTDEQTVVIKGQVSDSDAGQTVKLEVEIQPVAVAFANQASSSSAFVASGSTAQVSLSGLSEQGYHWQVRAVDNAGGASAWVSFGGNSETSADFVVDVNGAPALPTELKQYQSDGTTEIAVGGNSNQTTVVFKAKLIEPDAGQTVKMQVEVKAVGTSFTGEVSGESAFVSSGSTAGVILGNLLPGSYHWRARAVDSTGLAGAWASFGGNAESAADVSVANTAPTTPSGLAQSKSDGTTGIPAGGTTDQSTVVLKAVVTDADAGQLVRLKVEVKPYGSAFNGTTNLTLSPWTSSGSSVLLPVNNLSNGSYHWRAQTVDASGAVSGWAAFASNGNVVAPDFHVAVPASNLSPNAPSNVGQFKSDATTPIAVGGTTNEYVVVFKGVAGDPDGDQVRLAVEVQPIGAPFTGTATATGPLGTSGSTLKVMVSGIADGDYRWQIWTVDTQGATSGSVVYGGEGAHFTVSTVDNQVPSNPTNAGQFQLDGTALPVGGTVLGNALAFKANVTDPDSGQWVKLQVEVKPVGASFDGTPTAESEYVASGTLAEVKVEALADGAYQWRYRTFDTAGGSSEWAVFGENTEADADFAVSVAGNAAPGVPSALAQYKTDGVTALSPGATTNESTVLFRGLVSDPDGSTARLQVEVAAVGQEFTGSPTAVSALVPSGETATVTISGFANGSYHWRARTADAFGATSEWVEYGTGSVHFSVNTLANGAPAVPAGLAQKRTDGASLAAGASTNESAVVFSGTLSDPDTGGVLRLQVEVRPLGQNFTGEPSATSEPVLNGASASVAFTGLADGVSYHWRARTLDSNNVASDWSSFGGNSETEADFVKVENKAPELPAELKQLLVSGSPLGVGAELFEGQIVFEALLTDADGDAVRLEVEVRPVGVQFAGGVWASSETVSSGSVAQAVFTIPAFGVGYHWRARVVDSSGAASEWLSFGDNDESAADFTAQAGKGTVAGTSEGSGDGGSSSCGGSVASGSLSSLALLMLLGVGLLIAALRRRAV